MRRASRASGGDVARDVDQRAASVSARTLSIASRDRPVRGGSTMTRSRPPGGLAARPHAPNSPAAMPSTAPRTVVIWPPRGSAVRVQIVGGVGIAFHRDHRCCRRTTAAATARTGRRRRRDRGPRRQPARASATCATRSPSRWRLPWKNDCTCRAQHQRAFADRQRIGHIRAAERAERPTRGRSARRCRARRSSVAASIAAAASRNTTRPRHRCSPTARSRGRHRGRATASPPSAARARRRSRAAAGASRARRRRRGCSPGRTSADGRARAAARASDSRPRETRRRPPDAGSVTRADAPERVGDHLAFDLELTAGRRCGCRGSRRTADRRTDRGDRPTAPRPTAVCAYATPLPHPLDPRLRRVRPESRRRRARPGHRARAIIRRRRQASFERSAG